MKIEKDRVVSIHYTLTNDEKEVLDSSEGQDPLTYLHGAGGLIPGLERELEGRAAGDDLSVSIEPADAYGEVDPQMVQKVPMSAFEGVDKVHKNTGLEERLPPLLSLCPILNGYCDNRACLGTHFEPQ